MNSSSQTVRVGPFDWTIHSTAWLPTEDQLVALAKAKGPDALHALWETRERSIANELACPASYGWENPVWQVVRQLMGILRGSDEKPGYVVGAIGSAAPYAPTERLIADDILLFGGNRSGKTELGGKLVNEVLRAKDGSISRCWSQNQNTSRGEQQPMLFKYLDPGLQHVKRQGIFTKISYSKATGFSESTFVLPNRSQCWLLTYNSWRQDKTAAEGGEADIIWCDEEVPAELLDTLRFRTGQRRMKLLCTFTPIEGYSEACAQYLEGASIIETVPARAVEWDWLTGQWRWGRWLLDQSRELVPGCPPGHVPLVLQHDHVQGRFVVTLPTAFNPYIHLGDVLKKAEGRSLEYRLTRWFGWPTKRAQKAFPRFGKWHVVEPDRVPLESAMTIQLFVDPHGRRNWFHLWLGVDQDGTVWAFDEWPRVDQEGEWAVPGDKADGKPGPGQTYEGGKSFTDYKRLILRMEGWQRTDHGGMATPPGGVGVRKVYARWMDPRPAGTSVPSDENAMTYLEHMQSDVMDAERGTVLIPGLDFAPAPGCKIEEGTQMINDWLTRDWDPDAPVTPLNCPRFYVSTRCQNLIYSLQNWTGEDGEKGACKDPIDCLKAAAKLGMMEQAGQEQIKTIGGWAY